MAEIKSDFIQDKEVIDKQLTELQEKIIQTYNLSVFQNAVTRGQDANRRDTIVLNLPLSKINEKLATTGGVGDWKYGTYYLGAYPETGFSKMVDGQWLFIPVENRVNNSQVQLYDNAVDLAEAIKSVNPSLRESINVIGNKIEIIGAINDIKFPSTDLVYDKNLERVYSTIQPDYVFDIQFVNAAESDLRAQDSSIGYERGSNNSLEATRSALGERRAQRDDMQGDLSTRFHEQLFVGNISYKDMKDAHARYKELLNGKIQSYEVSGNVHAKGYDHNIVKSLSARDENLLRINEVWQNAYSTVWGMSGNAGKVDPERSLMAGESSAELFDLMMNKVQSSSSKNIVDFVRDLCKTNSERGEDSALSVLEEDWLIANASFIKVFIVFISNPQIAQSLGVEVSPDITPAAIDDYINKQVNRHLSERANDMSEELQMVREFKPNNNDGTGY